MYLLNKKTYKTLHLTSKIIKIMLLTYKNCKIFLPTPKNVKTKEKNVGFFLINLKIKENICFRFLKEIKLRLRFSKSVK